MCTCSITAYRIDCRVWVDLKRIDVIPRILKESVVGVEHLVREKIDPLSSDAAIVQSIFSAETNMKLLL